MSLSLRGVVRGVAFLAAVVLALGMAGNQSASTEISTVDDCTNGRVPCPDVACVSGCWADGTFPQQGSKVKETVFAPAECGIGAHGCITQSCHH